MQDIIAIVLVTTAVGYLGWRGWAMFAAKRKAGCGSCGSCPANGDLGVETKPLVTLDGLRNSVPTAVNSRAVVDSESNGKLRVHG